MEEEKVVKKESNFLWGLLGCLVPIAGLVLFFVWKKDKPERAKAAIIGFIIYIILMVLVVVANLIIFALVMATATMSDSSDSSYTSSYNSNYDSYYDSYYNSYNKNTSKTNTNTIGTNTISNTIGTNTVSNTTSTNTTSTNTTSTNTTSTNTTSTNTISTNTSSNSQRVGTDEFGYVTVPNNWYRFIDPDATSTFQYSYANVYIVTLYARDKAGMTAKDTATNSMYNMKQEGAENVTGATVSLGKYTAYQVYGHYRSENIWLVSWHFEAEDGKIHYISMEGPDASSEFFKIPETFSLKK